MIISRAPFRVSFFGGGTDFPRYYRENGGCTLSATINQYCYILLHPVSPCFEYRFKASYARTETVATAGEFQHPLIRECLLHLGVEDPIELNHVADLPGRTGLGSSSSFTVALLNALHALRGFRPSPALLAAEAVHIERDRVGDPGGHQDQYAAAFGGLNLTTYGPTDVTVTPLSLPPSRLAELERSLMLFYLGSARESAPISREQDARTGDNLARLERMKALVQAASEVLQSAAGLDALGALLHESWRMKRELAPSISTSAVDHAYYAARRAGASGGKLLGAGGGGFLLILAEPDRHARITGALQQLRAVPFAFESGGAKILYGT